LGKFNLRNCFAYLRSLGKNDQSSKGFTLIELLIVIVILAVLTTILLVTLNPIAQIRKSQDAQRQQDLKQISTALDAFYNDKNYYPKLGSTDVPIGGSYWIDTNNNSTVYMQKVPTDPTAGSGWQDYAYVTDGSDHPQWNVLFAKVSNTSDYNKNPTAQEKAILCPLVNMKDSLGSTCVPTNYSKYNYCVLSGTVKCDVIVGLTAQSIGVGSGNGGGGGIPPVINTPTPTPTLGPPPTCVCAATIAHGNGTQPCQGGGWSATGFDHSAYSFYCNADTYSCSNPQGCCGGPTNPAATCP
jgi:prepilin-type N-terminal cleavage/methylation domain-containing protein